MHGCALLGIFWAPEAPALLKRYLRVSKREQGRSGLELAAQRNEIEAFGAREGFAIRARNSLLRVANNQ
jgi:hypothetical protein